MIILLLLVHGLASVLLLGALTHQAVALALGPSRARSFTARYRSVEGGVMVNAVIISYVITLLFGAWIYPTYRLDVRPAFAELNIVWAIGVFEIKEHWGAIGLGLLPLYWHLWRAHDRATARLVVTLTLAGIVWFNFLSGHLLNNYRGL